VHGLEQQPAGPRRTERSRRVPRRAADFSLAFRTSSCASIALYSCCAGALVGGASACAELSASSAQRVELVRRSLDAVTRAGAYECAPRELALARAHFEFANIELRHGAPLRAADHLDQAQDNLGAAQVRSPQQRCRPRVRALPSVSSARELDSDGDGIPDSRDRCVDEPEDQDGFLDADGCIDADNDADTLDDAHDACPDQPGPEESHGCPTLNYPGVTIRDRELRFSASVHSQQAFVTSTIAARLW
jgi:hypothetical protein